MELGIELFPELSEKETLIVDIIRNKGSVHTDVISEISGIKISELSSLLFGLEIKNVIKSIPGSSYMVY
ncbi:MAG: hypothetical protein IKB64_00210 [Paludibacteraceae bacterium]|nr:hypothetical protein [Paludibacteraceae bacterium]